MKRVLIVGAGSYVGDSVKEYLEMYPEQYKVQILDARSLKPIEEQFAGFDSVFYVAGIAHRKETKENARLYYEVNRDLAIAVAENAKTAGTRQFIVMSTMAVYGLTEGMIKKDTRPKFKSHYGRSKLEADRRIWKMHDSNFRVAVLRPPMIYGKGCKGNYQKLRWLALHTPVFPKVDNQRSMLYIGNLCSFVKQVIDEELWGLFFPQNAEYVNTSEMVKMVALTNGKTVRLTKRFNTFISLMKISPLKSVGKVFGSLKYEKVDTINRYVFEESIKNTES